MKDTEKNSSGPKWGLAQTEAGNNFQAELAQALSLTLDIQGDKQMYHAWRVGVISARMAEILCPSLKVPLSYAGLLHDIGAVGIDDHVAYHPDQEDQKAIPWIRSHPMRGAEIMGDIPGMWEAVPFILDHHERFDGRGYPRGHYGSTLSVGAQIIRAADSAELLLRRHGSTSSDKYLQSVGRLAGSEISTEVGEALNHVIADEPFISRWQDPAAVPDLVDEMFASVAQARIPYTADEINASLQVFATIIDAKHQYTAGHSQRVARFGVRLALGLDLSRKQAVLIRQAGLLHDIGKVAVPSRLLDKPASLTSVEFGVIQKHPQLTIDILQSVSSLAPLAAIAGGHHEHFDGSGYPLGLKGEEIPIEARVLAVADAYDALTSDRAYRQALSPIKAVEILEKETGSHFDPAVVAAAPLLI